MIFQFFFLKEFKKYPFFFLLLFLTLFLGTLGLLGISIVSKEVQTKLQNSANELLTSDIAVSARREIFPEESEALKKVFSSEEYTTYRIYDVYSMITHLKARAARLVEIRATEGEYPFYGEIKLKEGTFQTSELYVSKDLADLWQVESDDELQVGEIKLKVKGIVINDSSLGLRGFSLAPRIYLPIEKLVLAGLIKPGSTGSFAHHFKLKKTDPEHMKDIKKKIYQMIKDPAVKIILPFDTSDQTARVVNTITNFMGLSALIGLILSLVGVFYLYQSHLLARLKDFCLMNLYGLPKAKLALGVVGQFSFVFFIVLLLEFILVIPLYQKLAPLLSNQLGLELGSEVNLAGAFQVVPFLFGLALFILVPLLFGLMRTPMGAMLKASKLSMGSFRFYDFFPFLILLWVFSGYLGKSFRTGNYFFLALMGVFLVSTLFVRGGQWALGKSIRNKGLLIPTIEWGIALRGLTRSGHKLTLSFLSLTMGATLISLILQLDRMIVKEFTMNTEKPSLFIFDIQEDQMEPLLEVGKTNETPLQYVTPMIRARLELINDKKYVKEKKAYDFSNREEDEEARFRSNGLNLTYRDYLTDSEKIIEGEPFPAEFTEGRLPYISLEKRWAQRMNIKLGDKLTFDIQGVPFEGMVRNIKEIKWTSFYPNFFVTIEPGDISIAPKTFLAILPKTEKEKKLSMQRLSVEKFPNVSFIDVQELVGKLGALFEKSRQAVEVISWLSLFVGLVILYGLSHDQVYRRYYDLALMKSLGMSACKLRANLLLEFGTLFFGAMSVGLFLGWLIAQIIGKEVFKLSPNVDWGRLLAPGALLTVLCLGTILVSSWRAVRGRPRDLLSDS